jgi:uncharacterized lipoprotein YehR (DUF1307 family)
MIKPILLSALLAGTFLFTGCGEDSSTEPRINYITMINATSGTIEANFDGSREDITVKEQHDKIISEVSEAPKVSYDNVGEITLHQGESPRTYVATTCKDTHITFTSRAGELYIVNTKPTTQTVKVNNKEVSVDGCGYEHVSDVVFENKGITIEMGGSSANINPGSEDIWDTVIFDDSTLKSFKVVSIDL